ncbi:MAG: hypothetical protein LBF88_06505 [Planctomycetaceae bacterium]|nr:hypothetical protein [Planctomycetaceae bacterium]
MSFGETLPNNDGGHDHYILPPRTATLLNPNTRPMPRMPIPSRYILTQVVFVS